MGRSSWSRKHERRKEKHYRKKRRVESSSESSSRERSNSRDRNSNGNVIRTNGFVAFVTATRKRYYDTNGQPHPQPFDPNVPEKFWEKKWETISDKEQKEWENLAGLIKISEPNSTKTKNESALSSLLDNKALLDSFAPASIPLPCNFCHKKVNSSVALEIHKLVAHPFDAFSEDIQGVLYDKDPITKKDAQTECYDREFVDQQVEVSSQVSSLAPPSSPVSSNTNRFFDTTQPSTSTMQAAVPQNYKGCQPNPFDSMKSIMKQYGMNNKSKNAACVNNASMYLSISANRDLCDDMDEEDMDIDNDNDKSEMVAEDSPTPHEICMSPIEKASCAILPNLYSTQPANGIQPIQNLACPVCSLKFGSAEEAKDDYIRCYYNEQVKEGDVTCPECPVTFSPHSSQFRRLSAHFKMKHWISCLFDKAIKIDQVSVYKCSTCLYMDESTEKIALHERDAHPDFIGTMHMYKCWRCAMPQKESFSTNIIYHARLSHKMDKRNCYGCPLCSAGVEGSRIAEHMMQKHPSQAYFYFVCEICKQRHKSRMEARMCYYDHIGGIYKCLLCNEMNMPARDLLQHRNNCFSH